LMPHHPEQQTVPGFSNHLLTISASRLQIRNWFIEQEKDMGTILFECPMTGRPVSTGIETEPVSFCRVSKTWLEVYCPLWGASMGPRYGSLRKIRRQ
jgi:hypothetical protein